MKKNPCYECKIHISGEFKGKNEQCKNCKKRFDYFNSIYDTDHLTNVNYNYLDNHVLHTP